MHYTNSVLIMFCAVSQFAIDLFNSFFYLTSWIHYFSAASKAAHFEICTDAQHYPTVAAAGMILFHRQNVSDMYIHYDLQNHFLMESQYFFAVCSVLLSPYS